MIKQRKIIPHKGGRTARIDLRARPDIKAKLERHAKAAGVTVADLIEQLVDNLPPRKD